MRCASPPSGTPLPAMPSASLTIHHPELGVMRKEKLDAPGIENVLADHGRWLGPDGDVAVPFQAPETGHPAAWEKAVRSCRLLAWWPVVWVTLQHDPRPIATHQ